MRKKLLIAGILDIVVSVIWLILGIFNDIILAVGVFLIITGILNILYSKWDIGRLYEKKNMLLTIGIISLPFCLLSGILLIVESNSIEKEYRMLQKDGEYVKLKSKEKPTNEARKIDFLLKIGVIMIAIAGVMIATTSWQNISNSIKAIAIAVIGALFFALSIFSEKKLKIEGTTITYWTLGIISLILSLFVVGNYGLFGNWFSVSGEGKNIFIAVLAMFSAILSYATYKKFNYKFFFYMMCIGITTALVMLLNFFSKQEGLPLLIMIIVTAIVNILPKSDGREKNSIKFFSKIITYLLTFSLIFEQIRYGK